MDPEVLELLQEPANLNRAFQLLQAGELSAELTGEIETGLFNGTLTPTPEIIQVLQSKATQQSSQPDIRSALSAGQSVDPEFVRDQQIGQALAITRPGTALQPAGDPNIVQQIESGLNQAASVVRGAPELITGAERRTELTESVQPLNRMPEFNDVLGSITEVIKNAFTDEITDSEVLDRSLRSAKVNFVNLTEGDPAKVIEAVKNNFPDVRVFQDEKGNFVVQSQADGQLYGIRPGFRASDIPKVAFNAALFSPAGRATLAARGAGRVAVGGATSGATQAAVEGAQEVSGGQGDISEVAAATALGGAATLPAIARRRPVAPATGAVGRDIARDVGQAARSRSKSRFEKILIEEMKPDREILEAADLLDVSGNLHPDHFSSSESFRAVFQAIKSVPGSAIKADELSNFRVIAQKFEGLIDDLGGTRGLSALDDDVKQALKGVQKELDDVASGAYAELEKRIGNNSVNAANALRIVTSEAERHGANADQVLKPLEKRILRIFSPREGGQATYATLDRVRRDLTAQRVRATTGRPDVKDMDLGLIKRYEAALLKDQQAAVEAAGGTELLDVFNTARSTVAARKGVERDLAFLFGREWHGSMISKLDRATKALSRGDRTQFEKILNAVDPSDFKDLKESLVNVPKGLRRQVAASSLNVAYGLSRSKGGMSFTLFHKWFQGLKRNKSAFLSFMDSFTLDQRKRIMAIAKVSEGLWRSSREAITTGRINIVKDQIEIADNLANRIWQISKGAGVGAAVGDLVSLPFLAAAAGATRAVKGKGSKSAIESALKMMESPSFQKAAGKAAMDGAEKTAQRINKLPTWKKFINTLRNRRSDDPSVKELLRNPVTWLNGVLQSAGAEGDQ